MKRYIKIHNKWVDTIEALKDGICYILIGKWVYDAYTDIKYGHLQDETDTLEDEIDVL